MFGKKNLTLAALLICTGLVRAQAEPAYYRMVGTEPIVQTGAKPDGVPRSPLFSQAPLLPIEDGQPRSRCWASLEFLQWRIRNAPVAIPLITGNADSTSIAALNEPGTVILFGAGSGRSVDFGELPGARLSVGGWLDNERLFSWEIAGFLFARGGYLFQASSPGGAGPVVSIPFNSTQPFMLNPAGESSLNAGNAPHNATAGFSSILWGGELNQLVDLLSNERCRWSGLFGFRYLDLNESLTLSRTSLDTATGGGFAVTDGFAARNQFYGGQIGLRLALNWRRFTFDTDAKIALGINAQTQNISGTTTVTNNAFGMNNGTTGAGLFAQASNIGQVNQTIFAIAPELQFKMGFAVSEHFRPYIGYSCLWLTNAIRPGNQIDRNVNPTQQPVLVPPGALVGDASPLPSFRPSDFWAHGVQVGMEFRY